MAAHPGGAPANYLAALSKFGAKTAMIGKIGKDSFGNMLLGTLEKSGIDISGIIASDDAFTTLAFVTLGKTATESFPLPESPVQIPASALMS
jgi:sugar/nucleoside kinase (ribokinase family)